MLKTAATAWSWMCARVPVEVLVLGVLALLTRLAWITTPRAIVFDEVYFRDSALRYSEGSYYFDLHPPLGKLLLAGWAQLLGTDATHAVPEGAPETAASIDPAVELRLLPALAGAALILVFYCFLRELGAGRRVATLGAGLLLLDNALVLESRLILIDSMLLLFGMSAITAFLVARRRAGAAHWRWVTASAVLTGMAVSVKLTGLSALGVIGLIWLGTLVFARPGWRRPAAQAAIFAIVPFTVYFASFTVHSALLDNSGPGDAFMNAQFQSTLKGNASYDPEASMGPVDRFIEMNDAIWKYERSLDDATHPYASEWTSWPIQKRSIYYYVGPGGGEDEQRYLYLIGNPVVWWGTLLGAAVVLGGWIARPDLFRPRWPTFALLGGAWLGSYAPFALIERPMFLYHYFFPLMFSLAAVVIGLGLMLGWVPETRGPAGPGRRPLRSEPAERAWAFESRWSLGVYVGLLLLALLAFAWFSPLTYGFPLDEGGLADRMWLDTWR